MPPNLKAYQERFGHSQSPEASRSYSLNQLDQMAKEAIERGVPIPAWRDRHKTRLGNSNDQRYKSLAWESKYEELAWNKSMSETLETYLHLFGHGPDEGSYKRLTSRQINRLALNSLKTGFPVKSWKKVQPFPLAYRSRYFHLVGVEKAPNSRLHKAQVLLTELLPYRRYYAPLHLLINDDISSLHIRYFFHYESRSARQENEPCRAYYTVSGKKFGEQWVEYRVYDHLPFFNFTDKYCIEADTFHPMAVQKHLMSNVVRTKQKYPHLNQYQEVYHFVNGKRVSEIQLLRLDFMEWEPYEP